MAKSRMTHDWDSTSVLWSVIANTVRDTKRKPTPFQPTDIHPFRKAEELRAEAPITALKALITEYHARQPGRTSR